MTPLSNACVSPYQYSIVTIFILYRFRVIWHWTFWFQVQGHSRSFGPFNHFRQVLYCLEFVLHSFFVGLSLLCWKWQKLAFITTNMQLSISLRNRCILRHPRATAILKRWKRFQIWGKWRKAGYGPEFSISNCYVCNYEKARFGTTSYFSVFGPRNAVIHV